MKNTIQSIIQNEIPKGHVFDAHSIIEYLLQHESDVYLLSHENEWTTEFYHSKISKMINSFDGSLIERDGKSWSRNIRMNFTENVCWKKL